MLLKKILVILCLIVVSACGPKRYGCGPSRCEINKKQFPILDIDTKKHLLVFENHVSVVYI
jgi:hypothetical protein